MRDARLGALVFASLLAAGSALAQANADALLQQQDERLRQFRQRQEGVPDIRLQDLPHKRAQRLPVEDKPCVSITQVRVDSAGLPFDDASLLGPDRDDPPMGRCLGSQGIALLVTRVQDALIAQGFVTTRVLALDQTMNGGVLVLTAVPGRVARVRQTSETGHLPWAGPPLLFKPGDLLNLRDIEQSLENLQRTPKATATVQMEPADIEGQSDLTLDYRPGKPLSVQITLDDAGSIDTGRWQWNATLTWANPLGLADLLYVSVGKDASCGAGAGAVTAAQ